jgi:pimeloyl-ACP methyl ester carboxylesterase
MGMVNVGDLQFEIWDGGSGSAFVFIHGVGTSGQMWAADLVDLAADFRLIVYNRRGYGASSSSPRNWGAHADDTVALIERLNVAPAIVAGYSGGASREQLLTNVRGMFADLASGGGSIDERLLANISVPVRIVDARLSPPFLRRSSHRLKDMLPEAYNVTLEHSGHWIALDAREDMLRILRDANQQVDRNAE